MQGLINQAQGISAILYTVIAIQKILQRLNTPIKLGIQSLLFCGKRVSPALLSDPLPLCLLLLFLCIQLFLRIQILFQTVHTMNIVTCCDQGFQNFPERLFIIERTDTVIP